MQCYFKHILLLVAMALTMTACTHKEQTSGKPKAHSGQYTPEYVRQICKTQPAAAIRILQTAEDKKLMPLIEINMLRSMVYFNSMSDYRKAVTCMEAALNDPDYDKRDDLQQKILNMAALEYYCVGEYAKSLLYAEKGVNLAYKHDDRMLVAQILTTMGQCHSDIGNVEQAIDCYDRVIKIISDKGARKPDWDTYYCLVTTYALKADCLLDMHRYDDMLDLRSGYEAALKKANSLPESINSGNDELNATFYSLYSIGYEKTGQQAKARNMFDLLTTTRIVNTPAGKTFIVPYLILRKRYVEALKFLKEEEQAWLQSGRDTVDNSYINSILMNKTRALRALGQYKESIETGMRAYDLADSLLRRSQKQNALWINEQLGKKMLNQYIGQKNKDLAVSQSVNAVMATLLVVSIALMVYGFRSNRKIRQKNRVASALINELLTNKQQLLNRIEPYKNEDEKETIDTEQLHEKFLKMEKLIIDKKLIVRPKLDRSDVAKEMGMTTNDFNALFNRFSTLSFNNYINDLRMELAAKMLKDKQNYTIEAIATECGIPVRQTFHRLFAKKFGMTPADYRNS